MQKRVNCVVAMTVIVDHAQIFEAKQIYISEIHIDFSLL